MVMHWIPVSASGGARRTSPSSMTSRAPSSSSVSPADSGQQGPGDDLHPHRSRLDTEIRRHYRGFRRSPIERAIIDGEVIVVKDGRTNFSELQAALAGGRQEALTFLAFDLLFLEGFDLRSSPLIERKRVLKEQFDEAGLSVPVLFADHMVADGRQMFEHARKLGFEGIISKKADAPYRSGRSDAWVKVKCVQPGRFPVVGFVKDRRASRRSTWAERKERTWSTWARSAPAGLVWSRAKSEGSSMRSSSRSRGWRSRCCGRPLSRDFRGGTDPRSLAFSWRAARWSGVRNPRSRSLKP